MPRLRSEDRIIKKQNLRKRVAAKKLKDRQKDHNAIVKSINDRINRSNDPKEISKLEKKKDVVTKLIENKNKKYKGK